MGTSVYIETWGCQMNLHQSEGIAGVLERAGYAIVDRLEDADIVLFNGCMVRGKAEEKLLGRIGAVVEEKRRRDVVFGVGGCFGQVHGDSLFARSRAIDFVFGTRQ
ncbi:MAG: tRNA (N6-isopentenyl adenosine(37)-C2)-methylthiotransferase MiaB, partial [Candidatus Bipolaricaulota bacterium]|nr:tRNA (N6-isopentenyl adenosine(37)-C2)-methylthiotransferase MiaB [Candidatus Bipolaricaulota bacterium]